jgi:hypothetical protein
MAQQKAVEWLKLQYIERGETLPSGLFQEAKAMEKKQIGYTEEQAYEIWKAGQKYFETSGSSITFEELIEKFKAESILQQSI